MKSLRHKLLLCFCTIWSSLHAANNPPPPNRGEFLTESLPHIETWSPPAFPRDLPAELMQGFATVRIVVDEAGKVTSARVLSSSEPAFGEAAVEAVKRWTFSPGVDHGKRAAMSLDVPVEFSRQPQKAGLLPPAHLMPRAPQRTAAFVKSAPLGEYPESLSERGIPGLVLFRCQVGVDGKPRDLKILGATHADFIVPGLHAFQKWEFQPATAGDLPAESEIAGEITFEEMDVSRAAVAAKNGITAPDGSEPTDVPQPRVVVDVVQPYDLLLAGQGGSASVEFTVAANGVVKDVTVREATEPAYGEALAVAMQSWRFDPALRDGQGIDVRLRRKAEFPAAPMAPANENDALHRLVLMARTGSIRGAAGLDGKLVPLYRPPPVVPEGEDGVKPNGEAIIEFVIDREGRARLPRVMSATQPALGWAAVTAVSQWTFQPPTRGGEPTEVRVQIPMKF